MMKKQEKRNWSTISLTLLILAIFSVSVIAGGGINGVSHTFDELTNGTVQENFTINASITVNPSNDTIAHLINISSGHTNDVIAVKLRTGTSVFNVSSTGVVMTNTSFIAPQFRASDLTSGSVIFAGPGGLLSQNNVNFYWDNTLIRHGIGTSSPLSTFHVIGNITLNGTLYMNNNTNGGADTCTLVAGNCTIPNARITAKTIIMCMSQSGGTNLGSLHVVARSIGVHYNITSSNTTQTNPIGCILIEPY